MFELKEVVEELERKNIKKVYVQFPEGLKIRMQEIVDKLGNENITL